MCVETTRWPLQLCAAGPECCRVRAAGLWFNSWFDPPCAGSPTLPGYLWQMPLYRGRSLQPIHGCCGMRLPRRFWPARSKPLGSRSVVSRFAITLNDQTSVPEPGFTRMDILRATLLTFGIVWPTTRLKEDQFIPPPVFCTFFFSPFSCITPLLSPSSLLSLSPLFSPLCSAVPGLIYLARSGRASGKAPGYICQLPGCISLWLTSEPLFGFTCSHLRLLPPQHLLRSEWRPPESFCLPVLISPTRSNGLHLWNFPLCLFLSELKRRKYCFSYQ